MSQRVNALKEQLVDARVYLNQALDAAGDDGNRQIYSNGAEWTLRQIVVHLSLADVGHNRMVWHYAEGRDFIPADYDIERYNRRSVEKQSGMTLAEARAALEVSRDEFMVWLNAIEDDSVLDKTGRHATLQILTLEQIIGIMSQHERAHADDILAAIGN